jgi:glycosyltransferase involved in cell wall biosynthesis
VTLSILVAHPSSVLTDHLPLGDGLAAHEFVRRLALRGHRLHVACEHVDVRQPLPDSVTLHVLSEAARLGVRGRLAYLRRLRRLFERLSRGEGIDVAHQLNPVDLGLSLALPEAIPLLLGPYVPDWPPESRPDGAGPAGHVRRAVRDAVRHAVRARQQYRATTVLLSTPAAAAKLAADGQGRSVEVLPFGVDPVVFAPSTAARHGPPTVVFIGSLTYRKGIFTLVAAHERVVRRRDARLIVGGTGEDEADLRSRIANSPARASIELLGRVERDAVPEVFRRADVACIPSYGEPFGLTALEAMASGLPVVGTNAGGLQHLIGDDGGIKVRPGDPNGLADALAAVLADPERRAAMGRANRRRVELDYGWDAVIDRLERLYAEAMSRR